MKNFKPLLNKEDRKSLYKFLIIAFVVTFILSELILLHYMGNINTPEKLEAFKLLHDIK